VSAALRCTVLGERQVRSNAAMRGALRRHHQSSLRSLSILFTCLLIWTHPLFERDSFFSLLFFAVGSYLTTTSCKHVTFALSISNPTSPSASRMVCSICQSVGSTSGLTVYLSFLFFSAISFSFSSTSYLLSLFSWNPFRSAHFIRCFGWEGLCHLA